MGKKVHAFVDGMPGPGFAAVEFLSGSEGHVADLGNEGGSVNKYAQVVGGRWALLLDGRRVETDKHEIGGPVFDAGRLTYSVTDSEGGPTREECITVIDGKRVALPRSTGASEGGRSAELDDDG
jgi:hypothetical protein